MIEGKYRYYAFISYQRSDEQWAKWLHHKLEHYKLPSNLNGRTNLPKEIRPVFKDTSELAPGNLPEQINQALEQSKYLIVVCSPRSAQSEWVNKEITSFISMGKTVNVIPFIIDGKAFADNPSDECFPIALRQLPEEQEILGANINEMGRDAAAVKVIARMFDIRFDELWHRHEREKRRRKNITIAAVTAFVLAVLGVAGWIWYQNMELERANWQMMENQARAVSEKANTLTEEGDPYTAQLLALSVLPDDTLRPNRPYIIEAEAALRRAVNYDYAVIKTSEFPFRSVFTHDGKAVVYVTIGPGLNIGQWSTQTGKNMSHVKTNFTRPSGSISLSPDNSCIALGVLSHLCVFDIPTGKTIWDKREAHDHDIMSAAYSKDGKWIASVSGNHVLKIWDAVSGDLLKTLAGDACVTFSTDGKSLVTTNHFDIILYSIPSFEEICVLPRPHDTEFAITDMALSPDDSKLIIGSRNGQLQMWDVQEQRLLNSWQAYTGADTRSWIPALSWNPDGTYITSGTSTGEVRIWRPNGTLASEYGLHQGKIQSTSFSPDGSLLLSTGADNSIVLKRIYTPIYSETALPVSEREKEHEGSIFFVHSSAEVDGRTLELTHEYGDSVINIWDKNNDRLLKTVASNPYLHDVSMSANGRFLAEINTFEVRIHDVEADTVYRTIPIGYGSSPMLKFAPDSKMLAVSAMRGIEIYNALTGKMVCVCPDAVSASFSSDSRWIACKKTKGNTIEVRDALTGMLMTTLHCKDGNLTTPSFSLDGSKILVGSMTSGKAWEINYPSLSNLIQESKERLRGRTLTNEEKEKYYSK